MTNNILQFKSIGTHWWIEVFDKVDETQFKNIENDILKCTGEFEDNYSRFKETSLISKLNREKILKNPSTELLELLKLGEDAKKITHGHFDIAVGRVLNNIGYDKNYSFSINENAKNEDDFIEISKNEIVIGDSTSIDLGGIGKGFLIDKVSVLLKQKGLEYFFINAGGDIYATSDNGNAIEFALENPFNLSEMIGKILIKNSSIASSSPSRRNWVDKKTEKKLHHLVNMVTGENENNVIGVYTMGENATQTDIASTALFVSAKELYPKISKYFNVEYLIVYTNGSFIKSENYSAELYS